MAYFSKIIFSKCCLIFFFFFAWFSAHIHHPNTHTFDLACRHCFNQAQLGLLDWGAKRKKHTTAGIRWWSPTQLLTSRRVAYARSIVGWVHLNLRPPATTCVVARHLGCAIDGSCDPQRPPAPSYSHPLLDMIFTYHSTLYSLVPVGRETRQTIGLLSRLLTQLA